MISRLRTRLTALLVTVAVELVGPVKLLAFAAWCWLLWGGVAFGVEGRWHAAALCWAGFSGVVAFVVIRPRPVTPTEFTQEQAVALLQALVKAAQQGQAQ